MRRYSTIDHLLDLTSTEISNAGPLQFNTVSSNIKLDSDWDFQSIIIGDESNASLHPIYRFNATEGSTYDLFSTSYFEPDQLIIFDNKGNAIEINSELTDPEDTDINGGLYSTDYFAKWVAPYTGTYYVDTGWVQGSFYTHHSLRIYEDIDTSLTEPVLAKAGRIFNWAEEEYSLLFPNHPETIDISGFHARIYDNGLALGEMNGDIYFYDGNSIELIGSVTNSLSLAIAAGF